MNFPCLSVAVYLTVLLGAPSRVRDTSAPASGFPLLSLTIPEMVAKLLLALPASIGAADSDMSVSNDRLRPTTLLMRYDLRYESPTSRLIRGDRAELVQRGDLL